MKNWLLLLLSFWLGTCAASGAVLTMVNLEQFYLTPGQPGVIEFRTEGLNPASSVKYVICDYLHETVEQGELSMEADGKIRLSVTLPAGYYELSFPGQNLTFGILSMAPVTGEPDRFFGLNTGFSWFPNGEQEGAKMRMLRRCGIAIVHEFLSWQKIGDDEEKDSWNRGQGLYYHLVRQRIAAAGLEVLEEFHDAPAASGADMAQRSTLRYPNDLLYVNTAWAHIFQLFAPYLGGLEVWNETDDKFGPVCGYVPMVKAIAYTGREVGSTVPVVGGIFSQMASDGFREGSGQNRMIDVVDAISYHNYSDPLTLEGTVKWYRDFLARYGRESLPVYITECGWPWTEESAKNIVMKAVEAKACGLAQMYPFFGQYYHEGALDFSMVRDNQTPYASLACYCKLAALLGHHEYVGDLRHDVPELLRARVFSDGRDYIAVIFSHHTGSAFPTPQLPILRAEGIDGREVALGPVTTVTDGMMYWFLDGEAVRENPVRYLNTESEAMQLYRRSRLPLPEKKITPIVLQPCLNSEQLICGQQRPSGYFVAQESETDLKFGVNIFNLSGEPETVNLFLTLPESVTATEAPVQSGVVVDGKSRQQVCWTLNLREFFASHPGGDILVTARDGEGNLLDYASVPLLAANQERKIYEVPFVSGLAEDELPTAEQWDKVPAIQLARNQQFDRDDFTVDARFLWDESGLYFRFVVHDIIHAQENDASGAWRQDSIQLAFDPLNSMRSDGTQYEFGISLYRGEPRWSYWIMGQKKKESVSPGTRLFITRDDRKRNTVYSSRFAWAEIPPFDVAATSELGFNFCVNNSNGDQVYENLEWTAGISSGGKDSSLFGLLRLKK